MRVLARSLVFFCIVQGDHKFLVHGGIDEHGVSTSLFALLEIHNFYPSFLSFALSSRLCIIVLGIN